MKKLFVCLSLCVLFSSTALGEENPVANLMFDEPATSASPVKETGSSMDEESQTQAKTDALDEKKNSDDESFFSFFNFGKEKKQKEEPLELTSAPTVKKETKLERLTREANEGNLNSQMALGYIYLYGEDPIKPDEKKAFQYYQMAAQQNDNIATNNLASLYYSGIGVEQSYATAAKLFQKAVDLGNSEAAVNLAFLYLAGSGVQKDSKAAINNFVIAAKAGNPTAQFMLGYAYYKGFVVPQDFGRAFELLKASADSGYDDAQVLVATLYREGLGIPQNYRKSIAYLQKAVRQGNLDAMMILAEIFTGGIKVSPNYYTAHVLYNLAAVRGAKGAAESRDELERKLKIEQLLQAQNQADQYKPKQSEITQYIHQTFGNNIKAYIDNMINKSTIEK